MRGVAHATRQGFALNPKPSQRLWNHSPTGYEWGYAGSGPAQLALALLLDATGDKDLSVKLHQKFKFDVVAKWKQGSNWSITRTDILAWIKDQEEKKKPAADELPPPMERVEVQASSPIGPETLIETNPKRGKPK